MLPTGNGVDNTLIYFSRNFKIPLFKQFNLKESLIHTVHVQISGILLDYPAWIFFNYPANPVSSQIVKTTIRCSPIYCPNCRSVLERIEVEYDK